MNEIQLIYSDLGHWGGEFLVSYLNSVVNFDLYSNNQKLVSTLVFMIKQTGRSEPSSYYAICGVQKLSEQNSWLWTTW